MFYYYNFINRSSTLLPSEEKFSDNFKFALASAAYQIEGGWNLYGSIK